MTRWNIAHDDSLDKETAMDGSFVGGHIACVEQGSAPYRRDE